MSNNSIWSMDKTLSGANTLDQSGPGSNSNEEVLHIPHNSSIIEISPSDCLMSYPEHSLLGLGVLYYQSVYCTAPAIWANVIMIIDVVYDKWVRILPLIYICWVSLYSILTLFALFYTKVSMLAFTSDQLSWLCPMNSLRPVWRPSKHNSPRLLTK